MVKRTPEGEGHREHMPPPPVSSIFNKESKEGDERYESIEASLKSSITEAEQSGDLSLISEKKFYLATWYMVVITTG